MAENKNNNIDIDVKQVTDDSPTEIGYQGSDKTKQEPSVDELKQQAGELFKAAGGLAGSLGKLAIKKGSQLRDKLEDEEFQEKVSAGFNKAADKIEDVLGSGTVVNVKGSGLPQTRIEKREDSETRNKDSKKETTQKEESVGKKKHNSGKIETTFEVEGNETVSFETKKPPKGIQAAIEKSRAERKAEKEKARAEKERKRKEEEKKNLITGLSLMGAGLLLCIIMLAAGRMGEGSNEGQIKAPLSSSDAYELNYEDVIKQFEQAGFTNVDTMKIEDLVVGWLASDGGVDKITIDGDEDYSTSSWYDPTAQVLVNYHTYPEDAKLEDSETVDEEDVQPQEETEATTQEDEADEDTADKEEDSSSESSKRISENRVMGIVLEYGQYNFDITFRIILTEAAVESDGAGTGWDCWGSCKWKDASRNEVYGTFRAHVTTEGEVDSFNIY